MSAAQRYEVSVLIGPCSETEADAVAEAISDLSAIEALGGVVGWTIFVDDDALAAELARVKEEAEGMREALTVASEDARILIQDYYSGLPEHRAPVDGAVARLAHLFERDDQDCEARTADEIVADGLPARAALAAASGSPEATE